MQNLIERLQQAEKGSRELDRMITGSQRVTPAIPHYTTSVDAALTLVKTGQYSNKAAFIHAAMHQMYIGDIPDERLALHICTAALKARMEDTRDTV